MFVFFFLKVTNLEMLMFKK